jgi:hypothetical protein
MLAGIRYPLEQYRRIAKTITSWMGKGVYTASGAAAIEKVDFISPRTNEPD